MVGRGRRALQLVTAVLGVIPVVTGLIGLRGVEDPLWLIPSIEKQTILFRAIWGAIFVGGIGRLLSIVVAGAPPAPFVFFTLLEIVGAPLFIYWQHRVARAALAASHDRG